MATPAPTQVQLETAEPAEIVGNLIKWLESTELPADDPQIPEILRTHADMLEESISQRKE